MISLTQTQQDRFLAMAGDIMNRHGLLEDRGGFIEHAINYRDDDNTIQGSFKFGVKGKWKEHKHFTYHTDTGVFEFIS